MWGLVLILSVNGKEKKSRFPMSTFMKRSAQEQIASPVDRRSIHWNALRQMHFVLQQKTNKKVIRRQFYRSISFHWNAQLGWKKWSESNFIGIRTNHWNETGRRNLKAIWDRSISIVLTIYFKKWFASNLEINLKEINGTYPGAEIERAIWEQFLKAMVSHWNAS